MDEDKKRFVEGLGVLLWLCSREDIEEMTYEQNGYEERVIITHKSGSRQTVNVSGDSCIAIMYDVYRKLI